jgi:hypothetical protein
MFSVRNKSNIRQNTPFGDFTEFESKIFYPISKIYLQAKIFFLAKTQFEVFEDSLPVEAVKTVIIEETKQEEVIPSVPEEIKTEETDSTVIEENIPVKEVKSKKRSL